MTERLQMQCWAAALRLLYLIAYRLGAAGLGPVGGIPASQQADISCAARDLADKLDREARTL